MQMLERVPFVALLLPISCGTRAVWTRSAGLRRPRVVVSLPKVERYLIVVEGLFG